MSYRLSYRCGVHCPSGAPAGAGEAAKNDQQPGLGGSRPKKELTGSPGLPGYYSASKGPAGGPGRPGASSRVPQRLGNLGGWGSREKERCKRKVLRGVRFVCLSAVRGARAGVEDTSAWGGRNEEGARRGGIAGSLWGMEWVEQGGEMRQVAWVVLRQMGNATWGKLGWGWVRWAGSARRGREVGNGGEQAKPL